MAKYQVTLYRVNEGAHEESEVSFEATGVETMADGSIRFSTESGSQTFGATTWGSFDLVRVPGSNNR